MWPYLFRWPGLVVLHDAHLHHARAWSLLRRRRLDDYRAELAFNHPSLAPDAAEIGLSGFSGPLYYFWPMLRTVVSSARAVAVHNPRLAADLAAEFPATPVRAIPMGVADPVASAEAAHAVRRRHGFGPEAVVLSAFGGITPEKRIEPILEALATARRYQPAVRLLLVGQALPHFDALGCGTCPRRGRPGDLCRLCRARRAARVPGGQRRRAVAALAQRTRDVCVVAAGHCRRTADAGHRPRAALRRAHARPALVDRRPRAGDARSSRTCGGEHRHPRRAALADGSAEAPDDRPGAARPARCCGTRTLDGRTHGRSHGVALRRGPARGGGAARSGGVLAGAPTTGRRGPCPAPHRRVPGGDAPPGAGADLGD